jgi:uncharacterized protein (DUF1800 family)
MMKSRDDLLRDPEACWSSWRLTGSDRLDESKAAHLHRRAGLGATWGQVRRDTAEGFEPAVRRVLEGETHGPDGRPADELADILEAMVGSARRDPSIERILYLWYFRLIFSPHALVERMTLAWHGHYATSNQKVNNPLWMLDQNLAQRELWRSRIARLHRRMLRDAAMLSWLDGLGSRSPQPNENLAREFLEFFALGEGNYTEADVRAAARALTGWQESPSRSDGILFDEDAHDTGSKIFLGQNGSWGLDDVVRIACALPSAATHIARRLFRTFIADVVEPPPGLLERLAAALRVDGDVDVARGIELILHSRLFFSEWCRGKRVKSPVELAIGTIRACERFEPAPDFVELDGRLTRMGQRLFYPPSVAGWPDGLNWLRGPTLLARAEFASGFAADASAITVVSKKYGLERSEAWAQALATLILGPRRSNVQTKGRPPEALVRDVLSLPEAQLA